jgi:hypothetical protein
MYTQFTKYLLAVLTVGTIATTAVRADTVFAYNKATRAITAVPATPANRSRASLETVALRAIRSTQTDVRAGRAVIVWADSSTVVNSTTGFVAFACGQAPRWPVAHAGSYWSSSGQTRFLRGNNQGRILGGAENILRTEQTGSSRGSLQWMKSVVCWDQGVVAR